MIETLTGNEKAGTVEALWPDVPPIEGATRADMAIPLGARLAIRAAMQGKVNFIAFTTNKTAKDVESFYSNDRMKAAGWTPNENGCISDTDTKETRGAICFYERKDGGKNEGLAIILAQDDKSNQTDVFYARIEGAEAAQGRGTVKEGRGESETGRRGESVVRSASFVGNLCLRSHVRAARLFGAAAVCNSFRAKALIAGGTPALPVTSGSFRSD
jgi:hypothetical protein